jgi:hypothetical protein
MKRVAIVAAWSALWLSGQSKPFQISGACSTEQVRQLALPCTTEEPCPLFMELAGAEQVGPRLLVTGNIHTGSATLESVLLISDDGGHTWAEAHARLAGAVLDQIQFADAEAGWVNGHVLANVPRDAFFLVTTDGGKTWRRRPVTSESRTGAVEQFWFDSRSSGRLVLDRVRAAENGLRYEMWESMTGGESWSIRQVDSRPIPFRRPERTVTLRLRTDASSKTHVLERLEGERWSPVASFSVGAGQCAPEAPATPELPPEPAEPVPSETPAPVSPRKPPTLRSPKGL